MDAVTLIQVFLRVLRFFSCQHYSMNASYSSLPTSPFTTTAKERRVKTFQKSNALSEMVEHWMEKYIVFNGIKKEDAMVITSIIRSRTGNQWRNSLKTILNIRVT